MTNGYRGCGCRIKAPAEYMWKRYVQIGIIAVSLEMGSAVVGIYLFVTK